MALEPGDCMPTGTPGGARQSLIRADDLIGSALEGLGVLATPVTLEREYG